MKLLTLPQSLSKRKIYLRNKNLKLISFLFLFLCFEFLSAQENFVTSGGEEVSTSGSITYSIGQVFYDITSSNDLYYINQGLQIPYIEFQPLKIKLDVVAYPNPTIGILNISIIDYKFQNQDLKYFLFGIDGKLIMSDKIVGELTSIDLEHLPKGIYLLQIVGSVVQANIKIIKNDI